MQSGKILEGARAPSQCEKYKRSIGTSFLISEGPSV
jgi:hypothetical protein